MLPPGSGAGGWATPAPGAPAGHQAVCQESGWVRDDSQRLQEAVKEQSHATKERPARGRW